LHLFSLFGGTDITFFKGVDPIVGSTNNGLVGDSLRVISGMDWNDHSKTINIQKGGSNNATP